MALGEKKFDVVVVGGGPGGVCAAAAAARSGSRVLLIERYGFLGGMATAGLVNPFMPYRMRNRILASRVFLELITRLERAGALARDRRIFDDEIMKEVLDQMMARHGVEVLLHSLLTGVQRKGKRIESVTTHGKSGKMTIRGRAFVDSTGDGDLAFMAGEETETGRAQDGKCQPMTLCFRVGGIRGSLNSFKLGDELTPSYLRAKKRGEVRNPREDVLIFGTMVPHVYHFNTTRIINLPGTDTVALTRAEIEGRRQVMEMVRFFRKRSPRFRDAYLIKMACQIGIRETRRVMGGYVLSGEDVLRGAKFPDGIARSNYPLDIHNPAGTGTIIKGVPKGDYYEVPFRCLVPRRTENLLIGSRCISSTHEAHSSFRVMPVVAGIGEAAGAAAAQMASRGIPNHRVDGTALKRKILG